MGNIRREKARILMGLSDRLWEDYTNNLLSEESYLLKLEKVRKQINKDVLSGLKELKIFASELGYTIHEVTPEVYTFSFN
ncbi:hypothetical protein ELBR111191_14790 [Elizabethkingia bruuniana]|uniref:hypothetical protein n=1 Tax=Elizabethkingia bruuniana TaxID=1756149 RepID=UPI000999DD06|nr:hypothetical protein [Elizabethkingia bruuniana]AQX83995.1 hypothetical protein AYC65_02715 [Elizabethkingia bruuniana]OPB64414.1 hypothetical protein BAY12_06355 [Elizabethkingia bruuniana]